MAWMAITTGPTLVPAPLEGRAAASTGEIALFPLRTVLLPGGLLPLRIFETRYVDLVGRCLRSNETFGVVLIQTGEDTEAAVSTAAVGTSARIVDFQPMADGLLGLLCQGERRFRITARSRQSDGLNCALIDWLPEVGPEPLEPAFQPWASVLRGAMDSLTNSQRFFQPQYETPVG